MDNKRKNDFTPAFRRIFGLTKTIKELRSCFQFSKKDKRAEKDKAFIRKWREIEKQNMKSL